MGVIKGTNFRIYDGTVPLGYATSCSLSMSAETTETISKDSVASWAESEVDTKSATLSFEGFASEDVEINTVDVKSIEDLFTKFSAGTAISWRFTTDVSTTVVYSGSGYITSFDISAPVGENATYSGTITVTGAVTQGSIA
jgi:predicted secreted protein